MRWMEDGHNTLDSESHDSDLYHHNEVDPNSAWHHPDSLDEVSMLCPIWDKKGGGDLLGWMEHKSAHLESLGLRKTRSASRREAPLRHLRHRESLTRDCWPSSENLEAQ